MIVGTPEVFALESVMTQANPRPSLRGLGYFRIHVSGKAFGRCEPDATMLANSYDAVLERLARRGAHTLPLFEEQDADAIADAVNTAIFGNVPATWSSVGARRDELASAIHASRIVWAPDGDAAFDDGSRVLQLDLTNKSRVIGFCVGDQGEVDPSSVREVRLPSADFYEVLREWSDQFNREWLARTARP